MAAYVSAQDKVVITGEVSSDARLGAGLMVSNPTELTVKIDRPAAISIKSFDGINARKIYLDSGRLTVFNTERNFYAHADVPKDIEEGMMAALEEFDVDAPLLELFFPDTALEILQGDAEVMYLTDKSRIGGVNCHHIVMRGAEADVQMWISEGSQPVPRKIQVTMKWESGSPRFSAILDWKPVDSFDAGAFDFKPPEGAQEIQFIGSK